METKHQENPKKYMRRITDDAIERNLSCFGAVSIEGPRGCGKTATAFHHCKSSLNLDGTSGESFSRQFAETAPKTVLEGTTPRLIDEWECVPELWDAARYEIDRRAECGQFVFTQSSRPLNLKTYHTGTGRFSKLKMETMTLYETGDSTGEISLEKLCDDEMESVVTRQVEPDDIIRFITRGGWPEAVKHDSSTSEIPMRYLSYVTDERTRETIGARYDKTNMELVLRSLARHEGTLASTVSIANDIFDDGDAHANGFEKSSVDRATATRYLDILERLYLTENTPPFRPTSAIRSSVRMKREGIRRFCDVSLACALLGVTPKNLTEDYKMFTRLFESLCVHDIRIYAGSFGANVFYYRDYGGQEIDAVIELNDGRWCAFDMALGIKQLDRVADRLVRTCQSLEKAGMAPPSAMGVICGMSNAAFRRDDGVFAVPLSALKP